MVPLAYLLALRLHLGNFYLNLLFHILVQLLVKPKLEQDFVPDEQGCEEKRLDQIVQQSRFSAFELAVPDKLQNPAHHMDPDRDRVDFGPIVL